ncbi:hypothetical protein BDZ89DRAFT_1071273 [Hymenopellis radicata]|nr:hypothetical protein BDZ89DRAFT_1071273 [Hymenopellis radicata]
MQQLPREITDAEQRWQQELESTPTPFKSSSREYLRRCNAQNASLLNGSSDDDKIVFRPLRTYVGQDKMFSTRPLGDLKPITLSEMMCHKVHKGHYLLCRTFLRATRIVAVELAVEDINGDAILLAVYHLPELLQASLERLDAHIPVGTVIAVREPWVKSTGLGVAHNPMIRVDSPSDIVFVGYSDLIFSGARWRTSSPDTRVLQSRTALGWKEMGNAHFKRGFYLAAAMAWTHALNMDPSMHYIPLNRSQAYLKLKWYAAARADAAHAFAMIPGHTKAAYRIACADYGLGRYHDAFNGFRLLDQSGAVPEAAAYMKGCVSRLLEETKAKYDWLNMFLKSKGKLVDLDVADFVSSAIQVSTLPSRGGGRGITASRDIKAGELLVVARPFAIAIREELPKDESIIAMNFLTRRTQDTTYFALVNRLVTRLIAAPAEANKFCHLYAGARFPAPPKVYPPPPTASTFSQTPFDPLTSGIDVDVSKIEAIATYNAFSPRALDVVTLEGLAHPEKLGEPNTPTAFYTFPSLFNHSCHPNALWRCFGNVMVIRSRRSIKAGEEICIAYFVGSSLEDGKALNSLLERPCDCPMCTVEREDAVSDVKEREAASEQLRAHIWDGLTKCTLTVVEECLRRIEATYCRPQIVPRESLFYAYHSAMHFTEHRGHVRVDLALVRRSIEYGWKSLQAASFKGLDETMCASKDLRFVLPLSKECLGHGMTVDPCILNMVHISGSFMALSEMYCAERWRRAAWWAHDTYYGGGEALFEARLGGMVSGIPKPVSIEYRWV